MGAPRRKSHAAISPELERDIFGLVHRHGAEAVYLAVNKMLERRPGRPEENDWVGLAPFFDQDAADWLAGGNPFEARSNNKIAIAYADANPGHNRDSTARRIRGKLANSVGGRRWHVLIRVAALGRKGNPYGAYGRAIVELDRIDDDTDDQTWWRDVKHLQNMLTEYRARCGTEPDPAMSVEEIENANRSGEAGGN